MVAVPLFFVISGATFFRDYNPKNYFGKVTNRLKSLAVPYFFWNCLISAMYIIIYTTPIKHILGASNEFLLTGRYLFEAIFLHKRIPAFWFIYNLMVFVVAAPIMDFFLLRKWRAVVFFVFLLFLPVFAEEVMRQYGLWATAPVFYFVGCMIGKYRFDYFSRVSKSAVLPCAVITVMCVALLLCNATEVIHIGVVVRQMVIVIFSLAFWSVMDFFCVNCHVSECMNHNFLIYAMHPFIQALIVKVLVKILPYTGWAAWIVYIVAAVTTIVFIVLFGQVTRKRFPRLYYLMSGGR